MTLSMHRIRLFQATTVALGLLAVTLVVLSGINGPAIRLDDRAAAPGAQAAGAEVVRIGLQVRTLGPVDTGALTFPATFDLWLIGDRLPGPADLLFRNATVPIRLGEPVAERAAGDQRYRLYHAEGTFRYQPSVADLIGGRLRLRIDVTDARDTTAQRVLVPDARAGVLLADGPAGRAGTVDGAWTVEQSGLAASDVALPTLGDPASPDASSPHSGVAAEFALQQVPLDARQLVQRLVPGWLAVPLALAMAVLLAFVPRLGRRDQAPGPWRMFTVMIALTLLLAAAEQGFATLLATSLGAASVQAALDTFTAAWLVLGAAWLIGLVPVLVWTPMERRTGTPPSALERTLVNVVITLALALFVLAKAFHLSAASIGAASGVLTIVLGIALQNIILDLFSGILLNLEKPFRLLNWVTVSAGGAPVHGQVRNMNWRTTQLQTRDNDIVSIPNSVMARASVNNHATPSVASRFKMEFVLDPKVPTPLARRVMREGVMRSAEAGLILAQPPPNVVLREVEDYGVRYRVVFYLDLNITPDLAALSSVAENVLGSLAEAGIELAFRNQSFILEPDQVARQPLPAIAAQPASGPGLVRVAAERLPAATPAILSEDEIALVKASWHLARPLGEQVAVLFYDRLFTIAPPLRALFRSDQKAQRIKLVTMLGMLVKGLDHPDNVVEALADLGLRHGGYGVKAVDYDAVGAALLWTLEQGLGESFDPATRAAWTKLYGAIAGVMISASGQGQAAA